MALERKMDQEHLRHHQLNITVNFIFSFNVSFKNISIGISILPAVCPVIACVGVGGGVPPELGKLPPPVFEMLLFTGDIWKLLLLLLLISMDWFWRTTILLRQLPALKEVMTVRRIGSLCVPWCCSHSWISLASRSYKAALNPPEINQMLKGVAPVRFSQSLKESQGYYI